MTILLSTHKLYSSNSSPTLSLVLASAYNVFTALHWAAEASRQKILELLARMLYVCLELETQ